MTNNEDFLHYIEYYIKQLGIYNEALARWEVDERNINMYKRLNYQLIYLKLAIKDINLSVNHIKQFRDILKNIFDLLPYIQETTPENVLEARRAFIEPSITSEDNQVSFLHLLKQLEFNIGLFQKLNFFNQDIVAIGANGSGKTSLSNDIKRYLPENGVVISAQKVLIVPTFEGVSNYASTTGKLRGAQENANKSLKVTYKAGGSETPYTVLNVVGSEFRILLENLLAERSLKRNQFCENFRRGNRESEVPESKLDITLSIWNSLIRHRVMECVDGINITLREPSSKTSYHAFQMSDGEKVILYLIAQVLQAPESGFIIIDEPEMYLHKTILRKLWDALEKERQDCIFIYLTHDLDFAASRIAAKKVWIKSFSYPGTWDIEPIPDNELPDELLLELLGSSRNILFCEGKKGGNDEKIYNILFPHFTVSPVDGCFNVINYTKAFNKLPGITTRAFGLIDADHHVPARLRALEEENVFSFSMTEPENLLLDEDFLKLLAGRLVIDPGIVDKIKTEIITQLSEEKELQVSNYVSAKINYYFKDSHVSKGNVLTEVCENYTNFTSNIKIEEWYAQREAEINRLATSNDYKRVLSVFNNKGLRKIVCKHFKISDFTDRAIKFLQLNPASHTLLSRYFPPAISTDGNVK